MCASPSTGIHFGVMACEACKGFFRRSINRQTMYKCSFDNQCQITASNRNCRYCRFLKCINVGMSVESAKVGRKTNIVKQQIIQDKNARAEKRKEMCLDDYAINEEQVQAKKAHLSNNNEENSFDSNDTSVSSTNPTISSSPVTRQETTDYYSEVVDLNQNMLQSAFSFYNQNQFRYPSATTYSTDYLNGFYNYQNTYLRNSSSNAFDSAFYNYQSTYNPNSFQTNLYDRN